MTFLGLEGASVVDDVEFCLGLSCLLMVVKGITGNLSKACSKRYRFRHEFDVILQIARLATLLLCLDLQNAISTKYGGRNTRVPALNAVAISTIDV